jgi:hypothetical protein
MLRLPCLHAATLTSGLHWPTPVLQAVHHNNRISCLAEMKLGMASTLILMMAFTCANNYVHAAPVAAVAKTIVRQLLQSNAPKVFQCDGSQPFNFYVAPGFGCFMDSPGCSRDWYVSSASKVTAIQKRARLAGTNVASIRCVNRLEYHH